MIIIIILLENGKFKLEILLNIKCIEWKILVGYLGIFHEFNNKNISRNVSILLNSIKLCVK